jgi:hypothetical protein
MHARLWHDKHLQWTTIATVYLFFIRQYFKECYRFYVALVCYISRFYVALVCYISRFYVAIRGLLYQNSTRYFNFLPPDATIWHMVCILIQLHNAHQNHSSNHVLRTLTFQHSAIFTNFASIIKLPVFFFT